MKTAFDGAMSRETNPVPQTSAYAMRNPVVKKRVKRLICNDHAEQRVRYKLFITSC
jgi:hypothetical protein